MNFKVNLMKDMIDFIKKLELTSNILNKYYPNIKIDFQETKLLKNYRNKTVYSINSKQDEESFRIIDKKHIEIIMDICKLPSAIAIKDIFLKSNINNDIQICFTLYQDKLNQLNPHIYLNNLLKYIKTDIYSVYFRIYNERSKSKFDTKEINQIPLNNYKIKLNEVILGKKLYLSPYTFSRIHPEISNMIYSKILNIYPIEISNIILYGRDIYYLYKYFSLYKPEKNILALTHCKITYNDILEDNDLGFLNKKIDRNFNNLKYCKKSEYTEEILKNSKMDKQYQFILTAGRNGLPKSLLDYFMCQSNISNIIYIACNRNTMGRDLNILHPKYELSNSIIMDEFPQTDYNNTILSLKLK